jgi:hypothetical protein
LVAYAVVRTEERAFSVMRCRVYLRLYVALGTFAVLAAAALAGCAASGNTSSGTQFGLLDQLLGKGPAEVYPPPPPEVESCGTLAQCKLTLKRMVDDPKRGWVGEQHSAGAYADGTRLFAYRAVRKKLSCPQLSLALTEVRAASKSLAGSVTGVSPEQLSRTRTLSTQVEAELAKEQAGRCRA